MFFAQPKCASTRFRSWVANATFISPSSWLSVVKCRRADDLKTSRRRGSRACLMPPRVRPRLRPRPRPAPAIRDEQLPMRRSDPGCRDIRPTARCPAPSRSNIGKPIRNSGMCSRSAACRPWEWVISRSQPAPSRGFRDPRDRRSARLVGNRSSTVMRVVVTAAVTCAPISVSQLPTHHSRSGSAPIASCLPPM